MALHRPGHWKSARKQGDEWCVYNFDRVEYRFVSFDALKNYVLQEQFTVNGVFLSEAEPQSNA